MCVCVCVCVWDKKSRGDSRSLKRWWHSTNIDQNVNTMVNIGQMSCPYTVQVDKVLLWQANPLQHETNFTLGDKVFD